jgi:integrase
VTITRDELVGQVLPALPRRYRAVVATAAGAGLRWGECVGLRRRNVDLLRRELHVVEVAVEVAGRVTFKLYPKSKASRRTVPLPDFLIAALAEHLAAFPAELDERVFRNERGGPLRRPTSGNGCGCPRLIVPAWWRGRSSMTSAIAMRPG